VNDETTNEPTAESTPPLNAAANDTTAAMPAPEPPAPPGSDPLLDALRQVIDPELFVNVVDLGLVYAVNRVERKVLVDMTLTSPACPAGPQIIHQSRMALERLEDVDEAEINLVMSPPWSPERMTDDARDQLGIF
jgi:metal-sulfur cluster biosynthetic enzyme